MKEFTCLFKVEYVDINDKPAIECGIIPADDFRDAINYLEGELYGTDLIKIHCMELFDAAPTFPVEMFDILHKHLEEG